MREILSLKSEALLTKMGFKVWALPAIETFQFLMLLKANSKLKAVCMTIEMSRAMRKPTFWFPTWSDINQAV